MYVELCVYRISVYKMREKSTNAILGKRTRDEDEARDELNQKSRQTRTQPAVSPCMRVVASDALGA